MRYLYALSALFVGFLLAFLSLAPRDKVENLFGKHREHCDQPLCFRNGHAHCDNPKWAREHP